MTQPEPLETTGEPIGPQAAAAALEVNAVPDDGGAGSPGSTGDAPQGASENEWTEALDTTFKIAFGALASRWPKMALADAQRDALVRAWAPVCAKRWGAALTPESQALFVTGLVLGPKVIATVIDVRRARAAQRAADEGASENAPAAATS